MTQLPTRFRDFYPIYLAGHSHAANRAVHYCGAAVVVFSAILAIVTRHYWIFPAVVAATYAVLWVSHGLIEKNVPVTLAGGWKPVLLSMCSEFYMTWRFLTGKLAGDLERFKIRPPADSSLEQERQ